MEKEIKVVPPKGYEIDKENSTFDCIKFKPIEKKRWADDKNANIEGYYINNISNICNVKYCSRPNSNNKDNYNIFATKKQAKSALAMARISQIMANDERFGGPITDEEWNNILCRKQVITRENSAIYLATVYNNFSFLAFHTEAQLDLFLEENEQLVKDYLMID